MRWMAESILAAGALWLAVQVLAYFLDFTLKPEYRYLGLAVFLLVTSGVASIRLLYRLSGVSLPGSMTQGFPRA